MVRHFIYKQLLVITGSILLLLSFATFSFPEEARQVSKQSPINSHDEKVKTDTMKAPKASKADSAQIRLSDGLYASITTNKGTILISLEFDKVPLTVANFVGLAEGSTPNIARDSGKPYYDGIIFHRVVPGFIIQGGDPTSTGRGGPGYRFPDEFDPSLRHGTAGILSMANAGPNTNGSQFFITLTETSHLDDKHSVFGHVKEGMDVVNAITEGDTIIKINIIRKGDRAKSFAPGTNDAFAKIQKTAADACEQQRIVQRKEKEESAKAVDGIKKKYPDAVTTQSGLMYVVKKQGTGKSPEKGTRISVHYTGTLLNGKEFDCSVGRNQPFSFNVGKGDVIAGWDEAFLAMKKGEQRILIIPPELAYGSRGAGGGIIPPNSWLVFEVELIGF